MKRKLQNFIYTALLLFSFATSIFAQPANDDCANAAVVTEGVDQAFTTIDATTDGAAHADDCASGGATPDITHNDVWYSYTASFTGVAEWSFCSTANFDTKIYIYGSGAACPPSDADILACSEDGTGCDNFTSAAIFNVTMGETYLLRVGGFGDGEPGESGEGTFNLGEFVSNAPPNDNCENAQVIEAGTGQMLTNIDATTDGPDHPGNPCFGFGDITVQTDVWYSFTASFTGSVQWSTCNTVDFDSRLAVYSGDAACPVGDGDLLACNDDGGGCAGFTSSLIFDVIMGETYLLRLGGFDGETGSGTMDLIEIIPPDPPENDLCENPGNAFVMSIQEADDLTFQFEGSTIAAGFDTESFLFPRCLANTGGGEFADVWYTFDPMGLEEIEVRFFALTDNSVFFFDIWEDCDSLAFAPIMEDCIIIDESTDAFLQHTITNIPTTQSQYYIRVMTRLTSDIPGDFLFQLVADIEPVSIEELELNEFKFFPNPVTDIAQLEFDLPAAADIQFEIVDVLGQRVYFEDKGNLLSGKHNLLVDMSDFSKGMYLLSIRSDEQEKNIKIIKN